MIKRIDIKELTSYEVADDGSAIRMLVNDAEAQPLAIDFPMECLNSLLMTLPSMVMAALRQRYKDATLKLTYPLAQFDISFASDLTTRILTMTTPDGFSVSFSLSEAQHREIRQTNPQLSDVQKRILN